MRPCDCKSKYDELKLKEQGYGTCDASINLDGGRVYIEYGPCKLRVPRPFMKRIAEWYLEEQDES